MIDIVQKNSDRVNLIFHLKDEKGAILNVSTATAITLKFKKPVSGNTVTATAVFVTDGTNGQVKYVPDNTFLDEAGVWLVQADVTTPTYHIPTAVVMAFEVKDNL